MMSLATLMDTLINPFTCNGTFTIEFWHTLAMELDTLLTQPNKSNVENRTVLYGA